MELSKAFFLVLLFAISPFGLLWLSTQEEFTGMMSMTAWVAILVMIGLEKGA